MKSNDDLLDEFGLAQEKIIGANHIQAEEFEDLGFLMPSDKSILDALRIDPVIISSEMSNSSNSRWKWKGGSSPIEIAKESLGTWLDED